MSNQPPQRILFPFVIWLLWKERNDVVFRGQNFRPGVHSEAVFQALEFLHCVVNPKISALGNPGRAGCGGIIRNDLGDWLGGFSRCIGITTSFISELWALRDGLNLCHNMHFQVVDIQINAKAIVDVISNPSYSNRVVMPIVEDCRQLISQLGQVRIGHCYREANYCADFLARKGAFQDCCFCVYQDPHVDLLDLISADKEGVFCTRAIPDLAFCLKLLLMKFHFTKKKEYTLHINEDLINVMNYALNNNQCVASCRNDNNIKHLI
ncbi:hypothetical protein SO802_007628 [Lithocarpus litseifolius]|uniref:RNase H type-1 domain-containing protein n=1 Tax=Lithocarpus litseifolius TaxID=425828 RepID=A0AAW2DTC9_9ROSI